MANDNSFNEATYKIILAKAKAAYAEKKPRVESITVEVNSLELVAMAKCLLIGERSLIADRNLAVNIGDERHLYSAEFNRLILDSLASKVKAVGDAAFAKVKEEDDIKPMSEFFAEEENKNQ